MCTKNEKEVKISTSCAVCKSKELTGIDEAPASERMLCSPMEQLDYRIGNHNPHKRDLQEISQTRVYLSVT